MSDSYIPDNEPRYILLSLEELAAKKLPHSPTFRKAAAEITRLRAELAAVTAERDRMREELEFYGWAEHWVNKPYRQSVIAYDRGRRARAALEGVTEPATGDSNA